MKEETGKERGCLGFGGRAWPDSKAVKFAVDEVIRLAPATSVSPVADYFRVVSKLYVARLLRCQFDGSNRCQLDNDIVARFRGIDIGQLDEVYPFSLIEQEVLPSRVSELHRFEASLNQHKLFPDTTLIRRYLLARSQAVEAGVDLETYEVIFPRFG